MIESSIIFDSIGEHSPRLVTMLARYPKFVHGEHLRHRSFSFSVSSSRAIPVSKNLEEVRSDELRAAPVWWGREQKGMSSGEELDAAGLHNAKHCWKQAAQYAAGMAEHLASHGAHKSIVNRLLEPFLHVNVLVTGTEPGWMNFFGLRLDKAAQPEIRALAEAQWRAWSEGRPQTLRLDEWHLPFTEETDWESGRERFWAGLKNIQDIMIRISVARCARLSYLSFETSRRSTVEEDLRLYSKLVGFRPIHASPAEHQATPDEYKRFSDAIQWANPSEWKHAYQAGNLGPGWRQFRKMLPGESIAPLTSEYQQL